MTIRLNPKGWIPLLLVGMVAVLGIQFTLSGYLNQDQDNEESLIVETIMPDLNDSYAQGEKSYQTFCSTCHGKSLGGRQGLGPPFIHGYYKPSHHADIAFYRAVELGVAAHHW